LPESGAFDDAARSFNARSRSADSAASEAALTNDSGVSRSSSGHCSPVEHPGRNFQPAISLRTIQSAAENNAIRFVDRPMNTNMATEPGMMPIK